MLLTDGQFESDALKMMQSRQLLEVLVKNENLQATLTKDEYFFPLIPFNKITVFARHFNAEAIPRYHCNFQYQIPNFQ